MNNNDINYQVKLIDDSHYLKEKINFFLKIKKEHNEKTSEYFKVDSPVNFINNFIYSPKTETLKYSYAMNRYITKVDDINSKFELFQKSYEVYLNDRTQSHYESLKALYEGVEYQSIDYPRYNPYVQRIGRRLNTENNKDMQALEGETRQLNHELKGIKNIIDDMMETVELFEIQGIYDGKDYIKDSDYAKEMKGICEGFIEAKKEMLNNKSHGFSDDDIKLVKMDILYYENKNKEYLKFIEMVEGVIKNEITKKSPPELNEIKALNNSRLDILTNLIASSQVVSLNTIVKDKKIGSAITDFFFSNQQRV
ncbi:hypothetical protein [Providencia sp.]|uniref:hypothetical protein n=1 Tax=Providencia sp. TaxID=589 RepID=UPI00334162B3